MKIGAGKQDVTRYNRDNAMTPLNWMLGISEVMLLPAASFNTSNWFGKASFIVFVLILIYYAYSYNYFARKDPDRLQSEKYNLESQRMAFVYDAERKITLQDTPNHAVNTFYTKNLDKYK